MYKLVPQNHYNLPDGFYLVEAINPDTWHTVKPKVADLTNMIQTTIDVGSQAYKIMTVMYDLGTEKYFALCRIIDNKE